MPNLLYKATLAHTFGRGADRPFRAAVTRLAGLAAAALALGLLFAWAARELPLTPPAHPGLMFFSCVLVVQIIITVTLLSSSGVLSGDNDSFARWLKSLPLSTMHCSILLLLPTGVLIILALLLTAWPLVVLMHLLHTPALLILGGVLIGAASGLSLSRGLSLAIGPRLMFVTAAMWAEYKLCAVLNSQKDVNQAAMAAFGLLLTGLLGLLVYTLIHRGKHTQGPGRGSVVRTAWTTPAIWPVKQLLRRKSMVLSLGVSILLATALSVMTSRQGLADPAVLGLTGALLAGSFASDIRALARRWRPAEITALRGTLRFMGAHAAIAYFFGALITLPLAWSLHATIPLHFVTQIGLGVSVGLLAGTLIVSEARDVTSQFLTILLLLALLVGLPQLPVIAQLSAHSRAAADIGLTLFCLIGSLSIETKRNAFKWRNPHHA
jgi:hypothetical protein